MVHASRWKTKEQNFGHLLKKFYTHTYIHVYTCACMCVCAYNKLDFNETRACMNRHKVTKYESTQKE